MASLNWKRKVSELWPSFDGAKYCQGGLYFNAEGELIVAHPAYTKEEAARAAKLDKAKNPDEVIDALVDAVTPPPPPVEKQKAPKPRAPADQGSKVIGRPSAPQIEKVDYKPGAGEIDLKAWGEGKIKAQFPAVRSLMKARFSFVPMTKEAAIVFLVDKGIVTE